MGKKEKTATCRAEKLKDEFVGTYLANQRLTDNSEWTAFAEDNPLAGELKTRLSSAEVHEKAHASLRGRNKQKDIADLKNMLESVGRRGRRQKRLRRIAVAAAVAVVAVAGAVWYDLSDTTPREVSCTISPGGKRAVLTYADGRTLNLTQPELEIDAAGNPVIDATPGAPDAPVPASGGGTPYNTLTIPRGGEFFVTLPDKTRVWLNSETELRFPSVFDGGERRVDLTGEAFFEVAHDPQRAFIVGLGHGDITVYGTQFNVSRYDNSPLSAVLVEGSIGFRLAGGDELVLRPSQMLEYDPATGDTTTRTVDTRVYTSWIDNLFIFDRQTLGDIMARLGRWYDVEIVFHDQGLRDKVLSGQLQRSEELDVLLRIYEHSTDIRFAIDGRTVNIYRK